MLITPHFFERPCPDGWVYPCSLEEVRASISRLPEQDIEGLWSVGLVPATHKDREVDGRYYYGKQTTIHIYSYLDTLQFKLRANTKLSEIEIDLADQLQYGMSIVQEGNRYICVWSKENLRNFIVEHVLLHEVGHHVFFWKRKQQGLPYRHDVAGAEQFAEDYALRFRRCLR